VSVNLGEATNAQRAVSNRAEVSTLAQRGFARSAP
jgi:hypothetical protein